MGNDVELVGAQPSIELQNKMFEFLDLYYDKVGGSWMYSYIHHLDASAYIDRFHGFKLVRQEEPEGCFLSAYPENRNRILDYCDSDVIDAETFNAKGDLVFDNKKGGMICRIIINDDQLESHLAFIQKTGVLHTQPGFVFRGGGDGWTYDAIALFLIKKLFVPNLEICDQWGTSLVRVEEAWLEASSGPYPASGTLSDIVDHAVKVGSKIKRI